MKITVLANFKNYPIEIKGAKRKTLYYKEGDKLFKKYQDLVYYDFIDGILYDLLHGTPVIKNPITAGTEENIVFSGNQLHSATSGHLTAVQISNINKIKQCIKEYVLAKLPSAKNKATLTAFPICIELLFRCNFNKSADIDNLKNFYEKVILDCIQTMVYEKVKGKKKQRAIKVNNPKGVINNDNLMHIFRLESQVVFVEDNEQRTLTLLAKEYTNVEHTKINRYAEQFSRVNAGTILYSTVPNLELHEGIQES